MEKPRVIDSWADAVRWIQQCPTPANLRSRPKLADLEILDRLVVPLQIPDECVDVGVRRCRRAKIPLASSVGEGNDALERFPALVAVHFEAQ